MKYLYLLLTVPIFVIAQDLEPVIDTPIEEPVEQPVIEQPIEEIPIEEDPYDFLKLDRSYQYPYSEYKEILEPEHLNDSKNKPNPQPKFTPWDDTGIISVTVFKDAQGEEYYIQIENSQYDRQIVKGGRDYNLTASEAYQIITKDL